MSASSKDKQLPAHLWKPGQSGNPKGRPKGCKDKLGEAFIEALYEDFAVNGAAAIEKCRTEKPDAYLAAISRIIPKQVNVNGDGRNAFIQLWDAISNGMAGRMASEQEQPQALRDERPAGHA